MLLRKAVAEDGALANALNNLAYIEIDRGTIGDATVAMAARLQGFTAPPEFAMRVVEVQADQADIVRRHGSKQRRAEQLAGPRQRRAAEAASQQLGFDF